MNEMIDLIEKEHMRLDLIDVNVGDSVKVYTRIYEGDKERIQMFEGVVIGKRGGNTRATFTVRKVSYGVGVEKTFPKHSPLIERIEVLSKAKVRRAKLYYLRDLKGKAAKLKEKRD
jgi:large subunit ribosomal protein L19